MASLLGRCDRFALSVVWIVHVTHKKNSQAVLATEDLLDLFDRDDLEITFPTDRPASWTGRTVIHSTAALTYQQAHNLIHKKPPGPDVAPKNRCEAGQPIEDKSLWPQLANDLKVLTVISRFLQKRRHDSGSLNLNQTGLRKT